MQKTSVKAELAIVRTRLADATSAAEKYLQQLSVTENRLERLKSETVQRLGVQPPPLKTQTEVPVKDEEMSKPNGNHVAKTESTAHAVGACSLPQEPRLTDLQYLQLSNGYIPSILDTEWKIRVDERDKAIDRLQTECNDLAQQLSKARMEASSSVQLTLGD